MHMVVTGTLSFLHWLFRSRGLEGAYHVRNALVSMFDRCSAKRHVGLLRLCIVELSVKPHGLPDVRSCRLFGRPPCMISNGCLEELHVCLLHHAIHRTIDLYRGSFWPERDDWNLRLSAIGLRPLKSQAEMRSIVVA